MPFALHKLVMIIAVAAGDGCARSAAAIGGLVVILAMLSASATRTPRYRG